MSARIVPLAELGDPLGLQPLAERIFGQGDRRPDWFARKLVRECVDPQLSRVAIDGDERQGYVLVGTPPSRHPAARTAGTGVVADARGRGLGRALVESALAAVASTGDHDALELLAEDGREPFYERLGFQRVRPFATLLAFGRGPADAPLELPPPLPWDPGRPHYRERQAFLAEAWERTPAHERGTFELETPHARAIVHVCRENRALAIHRTLVATREHAGDLDDAEIQGKIHRACLERVPAATPVVLVTADRVSSITADARNRESATHREVYWIEVQRGTLMRARALQRRGRHR